MSQSNIYAQKENGDLRLLAEIEGESDPALAVDALLDEMPRLKQRSFVVIDLDNVMVVEAEDEIVQPRRKIKVSSGNGASAAPVADDEEEAEENGEEAEENGGAEAEEEQPEAEEEHPLPRPNKRPGRPRGSKSAAKKAAPRQRRAKGSGNGGQRRSKSPFKANPASAE
jgi:hypothetical protein